MKQSGDRCRLTSAAILLFLLSIMAGSCSKDQPVKNELPSDNIRLLIPEGWPYPQHDFSEDPLNSDAFVLGRRLFYDKRLSGNNAVSCGSCHQQFAGFAHKDKAISPGVNGPTAIRNSPVLFNLNWQTDLMWDGRIGHLLDQPLSPLTNPDEMDESLDRVLLKINTDPAYALLFKKAYGSGTATKETMLRALSQFMGMLVSADSKYDQVQRGQAVLSSEEQYGLLLFQSKCNACHTAPLFSDKSYRNNGIDTVFADAGRGAVTLLASDSGKFKVPSLRNVELSKPYMHDGRFNTLEQVLDHYSDGIRNSATLDTMLAGGLMLTSAQKQEIIAFLRTLTDNRFIRDKRFNDPFN